jgi:hypothetical protein
VVLELLLNFLVSLRRGLGFENHFDWGRNLKLTQVEVRHFLFVQVVLLLQNRIRLFYFGFSFLKLYW